MLILIEILLVLILHVRIIILEIIGVVVVIIDVHIIGGRLIVVRILNGLIRHQSPLLASLDGHSVMGSTGSSSGISLILHTFRSFERRKLFATARCQSSWVLCVLSKEIVLDRRSVSVILWRRCPVFLIVSLILVVHWVMSLVIQEPLPLEEILTALES